MAIARQPRRKRSRVAAGALAATGFVASAALGMGAATASPAGASTPTKIYACYSDTTDALSYLNYPTVKKCASGSTLISWNITGAQGAQGAQGAKGAQGSAGAQGAQGAKGATGSKGAQGAAGAQGVRGAAGPQGAQGAAGAKGSKGSAGAKGAQGAPGANGAVALYSRKLSYSPAGVYSAGVSPVVATLSPPPGSYAVNVDATVAPAKGYVECHAFDHSTSSGHNTSPTNVALQGNAGYYGTVGMTGGMRIAAGSIIEVACSVGTDSLFVENVAITATRVNTFTGEPNHAARMRARPLNSFTTPLVPLSRADKIARRR